MSISIDISAISQDATTVLTNFGLALPWAIILLLIWSSIRTGSHHLLLSRIWLLIFGRSEVGDATIESFLSRRDAFMKFRLVTGLKLRTMPHVVRLLKWSDENGEDVGDVKACGPFFDLENLSIKSPLPGAKFEIVRSLLSGLAILWATFWIALAITAPAMFKIKQSDHWYFVEETGARRIKPFGAEAKPLLIENCNAVSVIPSDAAIGRDDAEVLCKLMGKEAHAIREDALDAQHWMFGGLGFVGLLWSALFYRLGRQHDAAKAMTKRLERLKSNAPPPAKAKDVEGTTG